MSQIYQKWPSGSVHKILMPTIAADKTKSYKKAFECVSTKVRASNWSLDLNLVIKNFGTQKYMQLTYP